MLTRACGKLQMVLAGAIAKSSAIRSGSAAG